MAACERCWEDAYKRMMLRGGSQAQHYEALLNERSTDMREIVKCIKRMHDDAPQCDAALYGDECRYCGGGK